MPVRYTAKSLRLGTWLVRFALPALLSNGLLAKIPPGAERAHRRLYKYSGVGGNWLGVLKAMSDAKDEAYLKAAEDDSPENALAIRRRGRAANLYYRRIRACASILGLEAELGCQVIHSVVSDGVGRPEFVTRALTTSNGATLSITIHPFTLYEEPQVIDLNPLRPYLSGVLPPAEWRGGELTVRLAELADLKTFSEPILKAVSEKTGMPRRVARRDALFEIGRNIRWFYKAKCEHTGINQLLLSHLGRHSIDEATIRRGIEQIEWLLANPALRTI